MEYTKFANKLFDKIVATNPEDWEYSFGFLHNDNLDIYIWLAESSGGMHIRITDPDIYFNYRQRRRLRLFAKEIKIKMHLIKL